MNLTELAEKYRVNKRNQPTVYQKYFEEKRFDIKKILEIGISHGGSLRMWRDFFPNAVIYGMDCQTKELEEFSMERIKLFVGRQEKREDLQALINEFGSDFDLIVEDGGHRVDEQQISFGFLFKYVKSGGMYVIEDVDVYRSDNNFGIRNDLSNATITMTNGFKECGIIISEYLTPEEMNYLEQNINFMDYSPNTNEGHADFVYVGKK